MNCDFAMLKEDTGWLMAMICAAALATVAMDVHVWRKAPECKVIFAHVKSASDPRLTECAK